MDSPVRSKPQFLFVGNHPCLDFINTELVINGQPTDLLSSYQDLLAWFLQGGLVTVEEAKRIEHVGKRQEKDILKQAKAFRTDMHDMVRRLSDGEPVPQAALETINHLLRHRIGYSQISRRSGNRFERNYQSELEDVNQLLGLLGKVASDLLVTCNLSLVKKCQNPACVLFFYDTTKNHARHWCSMSLCGNRSKVAAHYHRHRKGRP